MHPALQPVTLLQPVNEAARPRGRRRRSETQPVKSWTSTQMTISKQPGSRQLCQEAKRYRRKSRASSRGLNDRRRLFCDRRERPGLIGGLLPPFKESEMNKEKPKPVSVFFTPSAKQQAQICFVAPNFPPSTALLESSARRLWRRGS